MTGFQKIVLLVLLVAATGVGTYEHHQAAQLRGQLLADRKQQGSLMAQIQQLIHDYQEATNRPAALRADTRRLNQNTLDLLRLRSEVTRLRSLQAVTSAFARVRCWNHGTA